MKRSYDLVGCGAMMQTFHAPVLRDLANSGAIEIRGCFDTNPQMAQRTARLVGAAMSGTPAEIRDLSCVDAVVIATSPDSHADVARQYLTASKHVLVEKPFVARSAEAQELIDLAAKRRARLLVNHIRRMFPANGIARRFVTSGPFSVECAWRT